MNKYLVKMSFGYAGTDSQDIFEAENETELNAQVFDYMAERLSWGYELIEEEEDDQN